MTKNGPLSSVNFAPVIFSEMTSRIRDMQTKFYSLMSSFKFVSCVLTIIMQVKSESEKKSEIPVGEKPMFHFFHLYDNYFCFSIADSSPKNENFDGLLCNNSPILFLCKIRGEEIFSRSFGQAFE